MFRRILYYLVCLLFVVHGHCWAEEFKFTENSNMGFVSLGMDITQVWNITGGPQAGVTSDLVLKQWDFPESRKGLLSIKFSDKKVIEIIGDRLNANFPNSDGLRTFEKGMSVSSLSEFGLSEPTLETGTLENGTFYWDVGARRLWVRSNDALIDLIVLSTIS